MDGATNCDLKLGGTRYRPGNKLPHSSDLPFTDYEAPFGDNTGLLCGLSLALGY